MRSFGIALVLSLQLTGCTTFKAFNELKHVGFDATNVKKGKSVGTVTGEHCVFSVLGYRLGGNPSLTKAMAYARTGKKSSLRDTFSEETEVNNDGVRYLNNLSYRFDGFNAVVFGKDCLVVEGRGYK